MKKDIESILKIAVKKSGKESNTKISDNLGLRPVELVGELKSKGRSGYDKIKKTNFFNIKEDINEWSNRDFALYISKKFSEKYKEYWDVRIMGITMYIGRIRESLFEAIGFCDNITLKKYVDFFFENNIDECMNRAGGRFFASSLKDKAAISSFLDVYQYSVTVNDENDIKNAIKEVIKEDMDKAYLLSNESMVLRYGVVLYINYLIKVKKYNEDKAVKKISHVIDKVKNKNIAAIAEIVNKTIEFSPYPNDMPFSDTNKICEILAEKSINKNMFVNEKNKYVFLRNCNSDE